jgi:hypothetical protein
VLEHCQWEALTAAIATIRGQITEPLTPHVALTLGGQNKREWRLVSTRSHPLCDAAVVDCGGCGGFPESSHARAFLRGKVSGTASNPPR